MRLLRSTLVTTYHSLLYVLFITSDPPLPHLSRCLILQCPELVMMKAQLRQAMYSTSQTVMVPMDMWPEWTSVRMAPTTRCVMLAGVMRMPKCFVQITIPLNLVSG